jgi:SSS family solute:Na+ symporter
VLPERLVGESAAVVNCGHSDNEVLTLMLARYCGPGLLRSWRNGSDRRVYVGYGGKRSVFATVWTYDIYRALIRKNAGDTHYLAMACSARCWVYWSALGGPTS